jgi:hypothetical protein
MRHVAAIAALLLATAPLAASARDKDGNKKPRLELRASPRFAFSPVQVLMTAELVGGDNIEEYNCPELEWEWDDGSKSSHEADCEPLAPGAPIERRFTAEHQFNRAGEYNVTVTMRRSSRTLAKASMKVSVKAGFGDPTIETPQ